MHVAVVGGGAVGSSIALDLATRGLEVVLLEREEALGAGASPGSAGYLCPSHTAPLPSPGALRDGIRWLFSRTSPFHLKPRLSLVPWLAQFVRASTPGSAARGTALLRALASDSLQLHAELAARGVDTGFDRCGILNVYERPRTLARGGIELRAAVAAGVAGELLDEREARALEPSLRGPLAGAIYYREDAICDPRRYAAAVGAAARSLGAEIRTGVEVLACARRGARIVRLETTRGSVEADVYVLAAGWPSTDLARSVGVRLRLEPGKGYHLDYALDDRQPVLPVFLQDARVTTTRLSDRLRLTGVLDLDGGDPRIDRRRLDAIPAAARRMFGSDVLGEVVEVWRGHRPCLPDGLPAIGRIPSVENGFVATGHATLGLTLAPVTGALVGDLVVGARPRRDLEAFRVGR